ncbi:4-hydroxy-tetrahydrodipicolinate synthase [Klenkia brasiliensis]|uniref:4-hydroxy-tetrahydrodipicolinate synthase n=1 Tax=Klenkia brasiliensis TaxID=333142 RepID=A0A1G7ZB91_9ACTN|nr:4-hydroxy-tetrahydrodipicolinate synthase [Klenkia brasiliensis]SDH05857.1 4-hydroxy-tetrahydrodipicolinate synthase [Klenkia brasiliensis]
MSSTPRFGRLLTAVATAFDAQERVDLDATVAIARHVVDTGSDGVVVSGTTGEAPTTTVPEDGEVLAAVREAIGDRAVVVAGVGTNSTAHSVEIAEQAARVGADGLLLVTPYYNKPSQNGILAHFRTVASISDIPVMLYDVPGRTGSSIGLDTYRAAREIETVVAVKDATGNPAHAARLVDLGYEVYCGDDALTLGYLAYGAVGLVSVVAHAAGRPLRTMIEAFLAGEHAAALAAHTRLLPAFDAIMGVPNYGATTAKAALQLLGVLDNRRVRQPLAELDDAEVDALRAGLVAAGLLPEAGERSDGVDSSRDLDPWWGTYRGLAADM